MRGLSAGLGEVAGRGACQRCSRAGHEVILRHVSTGFSPAQLRPKNNCFYVFIVVTLKILFQYGTIFAPPTTRWRHINTWRQRCKHGKFPLESGLPAWAFLTACGGGNDGLPQLTPAQAGTLANCTTLASSFAFANTTIDAATVVSEGTLKNAGTPIGEHCAVTGKMNRRTSAVDGQTYAIGFEMRLPKAWNGRLLYQANGGTDGMVSQAVGGFVGGGPLHNALQQGFAVISSDAGHSATQNPLFGLDPQARLDYGYMAVGTLTPMAKGLIKAAFGKGPDRSYIGGTSNGGRHSMVAASRYASEYDGFLAIAPGFNLPKAAVAQLYGAQQWAKVATDPANLETALPQAERKLIANAILTKCDALDGASDGLVQDMDACQSAFDLARDVPTCTGDRNGSCLTPAQKTAIGNVYAGARNTKGDALYARWSYDPGISQTGWADWKFRNAVGAARDPVAVAFIFSSPPESTSILSNTLGYALNFNFDTDAPKIFATSGIYTESTDRHFNHMRPSIAPQNSLRTTGISSQSHSGALVGSAAAKKSVVQENDFHRAGCARHRDTPQSACLTTLACHQLMR
jgi:hypothetical protein